MMRINKAGIIGGILSLFFIIIIYFFIDFKEVFKVVALFNVRYVFFLICIIVISMLLRTARWRIIINQGNAFKFSDIFKGLILGYFSNSILPAKIGEFVRIIYLSRIYNSSKSFLLGTIIVERIFDLMIVFLFLFISVFFSNMVQGIIVHNKASLTFVFFTLVLFCFIIIYSGLVKSIINIFPKNISSKLQTAFFSFLCSFKIIRARLDLIKISLYSLSIWLLTCGMSYTILLGLNIYIPFYAYFFVVSAGVLGMIIPSTSGGVGVYHAVSMSSLMLFGIDKDAALAYALLSHATDFIPNIVLGFTVLVKDNFYFNPLKDDVEVI